MSVTASVNSMKVVFKGVCGETVEGKIWKQGRNYYCKKEGVRVTNYGMAETDFSEDALRLLCSGCRVLKELEEKSQK